MRRFEDAAAARACLEKLPYRRIHGRDLTVRFARAAAVGEGAPPVPPGKVPDTAWKGPVPNQGMMGMNPQMMGMNPQMMQQQQMMQRQMMQQQMMMMQRMSGGNRADGDDGHGDGDGRDGGMGPGRCKATEKQLSSPNDASSVNMNEIGDVPRLSAIQ